VVVQGTQAQRGDDLIKTEQWGRCKNLVIAWIGNNVSKIISRSILFAPTASEVWSQVQMRFSGSSGS